MFTSLTVDVRTIPRPVCCLPAMCRGFVQGLGYLRTNQMSKRRHLKQRERPFVSRDHLCTRHVIDRTTRRLWHWKCSPGELAKRRALRRERRLKKAKKKKQPKKSKRFERRRSPPRRGHHLRKMMRSKHHSKRSRRIPRWKRKFYPADLNPATKALISSWLPCANSDTGTSSKPASNAEQSKTDSFKRQPAGSRARTVTEPHKAGERPGISSRLRKTLASLASIGGETCQKCRWAGKRRIVSRRRVRGVSVTRTKWIQHLPSDPLAVAISSTQDDAKDPDALDLSCLRSLPLIRSSLVHQQPRKLLASLEIRILGIFQWSWSQGLGLVSHLSGFRSLPLESGGQKRRTHDLCPGESFAHEGHTDIGNETAREVRFFEIFCYEKSFAS